MNDVINTTSFKEDIAIIKDTTTKIFLVAGKILQGIQDNKKYKEAGYKTFSEAVITELGLNKSRAYQLIDAAVAYENVHNCGQNIPLNEAQLRPIVKLLPEQQMDIWQEVAQNKVPTAKEVQEAVNRKYKKEKSTKKVVPMSTVIDTTKYITIVEHRAILEKTIADYEEVIATLSDDLKQRVVLFEEKTGKGTKREAVITFISYWLKDHPNNFRNTVLLSENLVNKTLFTLFEAVRSEYKASIPPSAWDKNIIEAEYIDG